MGKSIPSATKLQQFAQVIASTSSKARRPAQLKPLSKVRSISSPESSAPSTGSRHLRLRSRDMEAAENSEQRRRMPLAEVVGDCVKRWFHDTLKEAKNGDTAMQVLVGQMYYAGYGVPRDAHKGSAWLSRASKSRSSVWKVGDKHPGYNASDSDSDDTKEGDR